MYTHLYSSPASDRKSSIRLENRSRVAVIGGGPAGSFFSYFLMDMAARVGIELEIDIYEPRDFSLPAPHGCNMCAGVISETLIQNLAMEGINLPSGIVQKAIDSYVMHTDMGSQRIDAAFHEKRIGVIFRGAGPYGGREIKLQGFDEHLLSLAKEKGAKHIRSRVTGVERIGDQLQVTTSHKETETYDLLTVAAGVNTAALKLFAEPAPQYKPPRSTKTAVREYFLGNETVEKHFGDSLHVFLLDIPRLDFAMIIPKGDFVSVCLLGRDIDDSLIQAFLTSPEVKNCFPEEWNWEQPECQCLPRINVGAAIRPYADRMVFIGDSSVSRLYKDGLGSAYRAAKAAATCAVLEGISAEDFRRYYEPFSKKMELDNHFGRFIFFATHLIQRLRFFRKAVLRMVTAEQLPPGNPSIMSNVLWDIFTGSAPYRDVFLRTLHPALVGRFVWALADSVLGG
jgi:flavin-dependent dehydrogenase